MKKIKRGLKPEYTLDYLEFEFPGKITNENLLKSFDKYLRDDNINDPTNFIIKTKVRENYEFKLLPKDCWKSLMEKYGGLEI